MALDHTHVRVLRLMASVTLALTLVAACGSDDSKTPVSEEQSSSSPTDTTTDASTEPTQPSDDGGGDGGLLGGDPCAPIEAANLSEATGVDYTVQDSDDTQCTYVSAGGSVVNVVVADVTGDTGGLAFSAAQSVCDEGSLSDLTVEGAEDAYRCSAMGLAFQLGAIHDDVMVLVTGTDILGEADEAAFGEVLVTILENAVAAS